MKDIIILIVGIIIGLFFILGTIGVLLLRKNGKSWTGQGFGK